jgi:hypothetical protein
MGFIQARSESTFASPAQLDTSQIKIGTPEPEIDLPEEEEDEDLEWVEYAQPNNSSDYTLMQEEEPVRTINIPKPQPRLKREKKLSRDPKPRLSLRRD